MSSAPIVGNFEYYWAIIVIGTKACAISIALNVTLNWLGSILNHSCVPFQLCVASKFEERIVAKFHSLKQKLEVFLRGQLRAKNLLQ